MSIGSYHSPAYPPSPRPHHTCKKAPVLFCGPQLPPVPWPQPPSPSPSTLSCSLRGPPRPSTAQLTPTSALPLPADLGGPVPSAFSPQATHALQRHPWWIVTLGDSRAPHPAWNSSELWSLSEINCSIVLLSPQKGPRVFAMSWNSSPSA